MAIKALQPADALSKLLKINPQAAKLIYTGLGLVAAGVIIGVWVKYGGEEIFRYALYVLGLALILGVVLQMGGLISRILAWFLLAISILWSGCIVIQILTNNAFSPPLAKASCMIKPQNEQCAMAVDAQNAPTVDPRSFDVVSRPSVPNIEPVISVAPSAPAPSAPVTTSRGPASVPNVDTRDVLGITDEVRSARAPSIAKAAPPPAPVIEPPVIAPPAERNQLFLHYDAPFDGDMLDALAGVLTDGGWNIAGNLGGIEKTEVAGGYREVRFFFEDDAPLAARLALEMSDIDSAFDGVTLRDMSQTRWAAKSRPGRMEVYLGK